MVRNMGLEWNRVLSRTSSVIINITWNIFVFSVMFGDKTLLFS